MQLSRSGCLLKRDRVSRGNRWTIGLIVRRIQIQFPVVDGPFVGDWLFICCLMLNSCAYSFFSTFSFLSALSRSGNSTVALFSGLSQKTYRSFKGENLLVSLLAKHLMVVFKVLTFNIVRYSHSNSKTCSIWWSKHGKSIISSKNWFEHETPNSKYGKTCKSSLIELILALSTGYCNCLESISHNQSPKVLLIQPRIKIPRCSLTRTSGHLSVATSISFSESRPKSSSSKFVCDHGSWSSRS